MTLTVSQTYHGFCVKRAEYVEELHSWAYELEHIQSGARVLYIQNEDEPSLSFLFRTAPSTDSTGSPSYSLNILHCVDPESSL